MANQVGGKIQWSKASTKQHSELKVILGRLDVERLGFEESESLREVLAGKKTASQNVRRIESSESDFEAKIGKEINSLVESWAPQFLYLLFQPAEYKGVYKIRPEEAINSSLKLLFQDGNIIALAGSELNFGFLLDLEVGGASQGKRIEYEEWSSD